MGPKENELEIKTKKIRNRGSVHNEQMFPKKKMMGRKLSKKEYKKNFPYWI